MNQTKLPFRLPITQNNPTLLDMSNNLCTRSWAWNCFCSFFQSKSWGLKSSHLETMNKLGVKLILYKLWPWEWHQQLGSCPGVFRDNQNDKLNVYWQTQLSSKLTSQTTLGIKPIIFLHEFDPTENWPASDRTLQSKLKCTFHQKLDSLKWANYDTHYDRFKILLNPPQI